MKRVITMALAVVMFITCIPFASAGAASISLVLDLNKQVIVAYQGSTPIRYMPCSSGKAGTSTPTGTYSLTTMREKFGYFAAYNSYAAYWTQVRGDIYLHSVLFSGKSYTKSAMSRSAYDNLGSKQSHGCVRLLAEDAQWIYYNCDPGIKIRISNNAGVGALARSKAMARKVSYSSYSLPSDSNSTPKDYVGKIISKGTPLYDGQGGSKTKKGTLGAGTRVEILQKGSSWLKVKVLSSGSIGYLPRSYVNITSETISPSIPDMSGNSLPNNNKYPYDVKKRVTAENGNNAKIYKTNSRSSSVLGTLKSGKTAEYLSETDVFYKIKYGTIVGYVEKVLTNVKKYAVPKQIDKPDDLIKGKITASDVNCRLGPNTSAYSLEKLSKNTQVNIVKLGKSGAGGSAGWTTVYRNGGLCYVAAQYVKITDERGTILSKPGNKLPSNNNYAYDTQTIIVTKWSKGIDIMSGPTIKGDRIAKLDNGEKALLIGQTTSYYKIQLGNTIGFVKKQDTYSYKTTIPKQVDKPKIAGKATTNTSGVKIYLGMSKTSYALETLASGKNIEIVKKGTTYTTIYRNGGLCYIETKYLNVSEYYGSVVKQPLDQLPSDGDYDFKTYVVSKWTNGINIYSTSSIKSAVIATLSKDKKADLKGETDNFYKIDYSGTIGYVQKSMAYKYKFGTPAQIKKPDKTVMGTIIADKANCYQQKNISSFRYGSVLKGDTVEIVEQEGKWTAIYMYGGICYIKSDYVKL